LAQFFRNLHFLTFFFIFSVDIHTMIHSLPVAMGLFDTRFGSETDLKGYTDAKAAFDAAQKKFEDGLAAARKADGNAGKSAEELKDVEVTLAGISATKISALQKVVTDAQTKLSEAEKKGGTSIGAAGFIWGLIALVIGGVSVLFLPPLFPFSTLAIPAGGSAIGGLIGGLIQKFGLPHVPAAAATTPSTGSVVLNYV
jgi:hypothetical protein